MSGPATRVGQIRRGWYQVSEMAAVDSLHRCEMGPFMSDLCSARAAALDLQNAGSALAILSVAKELTPCQAKSLATSTLSLP